MRLYAIPPPGKSKVTQDLVPHQFSSQTEHYLMSSPRARKSSRNASAYPGMHTQDARHARQEGGSGFSGKFVTKNYKIELRYQKR